MTPARAEGQIYKYKVSNKAITVTLGQNVKNWTLWDGESEIEASAGEVITLVECGKNYLADAAGTATIA